MQGQILKFRSDLGHGVILAENGRKYRFAKSEIVNSDDDLAGTSVDFLVVASRPQQIFLMSGSPWTAFGGPSHATTAIRG